MTSLYNIKNLDDRADQIKGLTSRSLSSNQSDFNQQKLSTRHSPLYPLAPFNTLETTQIKNRSMLRVGYSFCIAFLLFALLAALVSAVVAIAAEKQLQINYDALFVEVNRIERLLIGLKDRVENVEGWRSDNIGD